MPIPFTSSDCCQLATERLLSRFPITQYQIDCIGDLPIRIGSSIKGKILSSDHYEKSQFHSGKISCVINCRRYAYQAIIVVYHWKVLLLSSIRGHFSAELEVCRVQISSVSRSALLNVVLKLDQAKTLSILS